MPVSGHDIGFTHKGLNRIRVAALSPEDQEQRKALDIEFDYWDSLLALPIKSSKATAVESEAQSEFERSPGSPWGGREVPVGDSKHASVVIELEGDVTYVGDEAQAKDKIAKDFNEAWSENNACYEVVEDVKSEIHSDDPEVKTSSVVSNLAPNQNGGYHVTILFTAEVTGFESAEAAKSRRDEEKAEYHEDFRRDEGL